MTWQPDRAGAFCWSFRRGTERRNPVRSQGIQRGSLRCKWLRLLVCQGHLTLQECAAIALLDSFNCTISGTAFHKLCRTEVLPRRASETEWIPKLLHTWQKPAEPVFGTLDKGSLFPPQKRRAHAAVRSIRSRALMRRAAKTSSSFTTARRAMPKAVFAAPIVPYGTGDFLDAAQFVVEPGRIQVLSEQSPEPVNFAACWNWWRPLKLRGRGADRVCTSAAHATDPVCRDVGLLSSDARFFRNSWRLQSAKYDVPIPFISDIDPGRQRKAARPVAVGGKRGNAQRKNGKRGHRGGRRSVVGRHRLGCDGRALSQAKKIATAISRLFRQKRKLRSVFDCPVSVAAPIPQGSRLSTPTFVRRWGLCMPNFLTSSDGAHQPIPSRPRPMLHPRHRHRPRQRERIDAGWRCCGKRG